MSIPKPSISIRLAGNSDVEEIVRVTNAAYAVEQFCLSGDRTDSADIRSLMEKGRFLVVPHAETPSTLIASVYMSYSNGRGYLGILSVDPQYQGHGIAKALVSAVEDHCRREGCGFLDINVVNLRNELFPYYSQLGFAPSAVLPFPRPAKALQPLHLIQMTKALYTAQNLPSPP
jgi:GNAT superfamily N-acetyltransferase